MLKVCPKCKHLSIEYDARHLIERCLNPDCAWVNRDKNELNESTPATQIGLRLEKQMLEKARLRLIP